MKSVITSAFLVFFFISNLNKAQTITYVNINATGSNNGSSWANAYTSLQTAISNSVTNRQIWVAKGTYIAPVTFGFRMKDNLAIYGGFDGTETTLAQRNWTLNVTILKGGANTRVIGNYCSISARLDTTAILDGFTITGGTVNSSDFYNKGGAGILNYFASPTLRNLVITGNNINVNASNYYGGGIYNFENRGTLKNVRITHNSAYNGAGMYNEQDYFNGSGFEPINLIRVKIDSNTAYGYGGGIYNYGCAPYIENSMIIKNTAQFNGGGIYSDNSTLSNTYSTNIVNSLIADNKADVAGAMYNKRTSTVLINVTISGNNANNGAPGGVANEDSKTTIVNSIIYLNKKGSFVPGNYDDNLIDDSNSNTDISYSIVSGQDSVTNAFTHCIDANPQFIDSANGNYQLKSTGPALNVGSNSSYTSSSTVDLAGNLRTYGIIDMGAYEFQGSVAGVKEQKNNSFSLSIFPNPVTSILTVLFNKPAIDAELQITDITGKEIIKLKKSVTEKEIINVSQLQEGIYFLKTTVSGQSQVSKITVIK